MLPGSTGFHRLQPAARICLKRKRLKTRHPGRGPQSALGAGGRQFESGRPDQWNQADTVFSGCLEDPAVDNFVAVVIRSRRRAAHRDGARASIFSGSLGGHLHKRQVRASTGRPSAVPEGSSERSRPLFRDDAHRHFRRDSDQLRSASPERCLQARLWSRASHCVIRYFCDNP